jgi:hypothetical protein
MSCTTVSKSHKLEIYSSKTSLLREINKIFRDINYWFKLNQLVLNYNKTHYLQFNTKNSWEYVLKINYQGNYVKSLSYSIMSYGIIFCGNQPYSEKIFKIQKRVIRIITNSRMRNSCRKLFQRLETLPLYSQYIFSLSIFVMKTKHLYNTNNQIHSVHTRFKTNLHPPIANLTKFQKKVYYSGIKILTTFLMISKT